MTDLHIPSIGTAMAHGQDSLVFTERQLSLDLKDCALLSIGLVLLGAFLTRVQGSGLWVVLLALGSIVTVTQLDFRRLVAVVAYRDYFAVFRSQRWRFGRNAEWVYEQTPGEIIAVLERGVDMRPEERVMPKLPDCREIFVFQNGRLSVLTSARMGDDEGIEKLHMIRAFFAKNGAGTTEARPETVSQPAFVTGQRGALS